MASSSLSGPQQPILFDVDCNLWHKDLKSLQTTDTEEAEWSPFRILEEDAVMEHHVRAMLSPSSTIAEAQRGLTLLQQRGSQEKVSIQTTVGVHPCHVNDEALQKGSLQEHVETMRHLLMQHPTLCAAVGECGLDASEGFPPIADQIPWFQAQIQLAQELQLPLFVHERLAFDACMDLLQPTNVPIIIHCFTGTVDECRAYIERGYSISISGYIFRPDAGETRQCLRDGVVPLDRLMVETDAPYMGFSQCRTHYLAKHAAYMESLNAKRRKRLLNGTYPNVPSSLPLVLDKVLEDINQGRGERGEDTLSRDDLARITTQNAVSFFRWPWPGDESKL